MEFKFLKPHDLDDFKELIGIFRTVFENSDPLPSDEHLNSLLTKNDISILVIKEGNNVIGGLSIYIIHSYYSEKPTAYIYDVGIMPESQGQGYGKKLMEYAINYCKNNGFEEAYVEAESDDIDAVNFYRKTNNTKEMNVVHFTYSLSKDS